MSFPNRDAQILAHILEYCNRIEKTLSRFGREFDGTEPQTFTKWYKHNTDIPRILFIMR